MLYALCDYRFSDRASGYGMLQYGTVKPRGSHGSHANNHNGKQHRNMAGRLCSMEQEREAANTSMRKIASGGPCSPNQSQESSQDGCPGQGRSDPWETRRSSQHIPSAPPPAAAAPLTSKEKKAQTLWEVECKTNSLLDEYLHLHDLNKAFACVREIDPTHMHLFVMTIVNSVLETTQQGRQIVGSLLHDLIKKKVLTVDQYLKG